MERGAATRQNSRFLKAFDFFVVQRTGGEAATRQKSGFSNVGFFGGLRAQGGRRSRGRNPEF